MLSTLRNLFKREPGHRKRRINLSRYRIIHETGKGSMSKVYRARDTKTGLEVALKFLDPFKLAKLNARYKNVTRPTEGEISYNLRHPNVVRTHEFGRSKDGKEIMIMEYVKGSGLNFMVETEHPGLNGIRIAVLIGAAKGLAYVHEQGYCHRDICSRNVMVDSENNAKLIDFGLAVPNTPEFNRPGNRTGTAAYMAPELIKRERTDHRVDVFAFGVMMYEVLSGAMPWEAKDSLKVLAQHINADPKPLSEVAPDVTPELDRLVHKAIARRPEDRFQTMTEVVEALEHLDKSDY